MSQAFQTLLNDFASYHQLPAEALAITNELTVGSVTVSLIFEGDERVGEIVLASELGAPKTGDEASIYALLLQANHMWFGTDGATLGMTPESVITLCARLPLEGMEVETFSSLLITFADTATYWQDLLAGRTTAEEPAASQL